MAYPTIIDLILIGSISGLIAICVYSLHLEDKLLSRVEKLEGELSTSHASENKFRKEDSVLIIPAANIGGKNEDYSAGKEFEPPKVMNASLRNDFPQLPQKVEAVENDNSARSERTLSGRENAAHAAKKADPLDDEAFEWPQDEF